MTIDREALYVKVEWYAPSAGDDDPPIRVRRVVGDAGTAALTVGEALHDIGPGETVSIDVEQVELHE